jgi:hypothetical protein
MFQSPSSRAIQAILVQNLIGFAGHYSHKYSQPQTQHHYIYDYVQATSGKYSKFTIESSDVLHTIINFLFVQDLQAHKLEDFL